MRESGRMTISKVRGSYTTTQRVSSGISTRASSDRVIVMDLGSYITNKVVDLRVSLGTI